MDLRASRPFMPGYGVVGPQEGRGLLPWSWAEERLAASRYCSVATVWPDGRPHVTPVWGAWHERRRLGQLQRKVAEARNLEADPRCVVTTDDPVRPVVVEGTAERRIARRDAEAFSQQVTSKYETDVSVDFVLDNALYRLAPTRVFGLDEDDFTDSPTRWLSAP